MASGGVALARRGALVRRPLVGLALAVATGVAAGLYLPIHHQHLTILALFPAIAALCAFRRRAGGLLLYLAMPLLACGWAGLAIQSPSPLALRNQLERPVEYVDVTGTIVSDPVTTPAYQRGSTVWTFVVNADRLNRIGTWQPARGRVRCRWITADPDVRITYGERWRLRGRLRVGSLAGKDRPSREPFTMQIYGAQANWLSDGHGFWVKRWCLEGRRACARILGQGLEDYPDHAGLLHALLLGYRHELPRRLHDLFARTGTLHIFAISGLHVGVMAGLIVVLLRSMGLSRLHWVLGLAPLLVIYTMSTGMKASATRAMVMAILYWLAPLLGRKPDAPSAFALAAILILAAVPTQLADPGFIFSFVIVAGLLVFVPRFMEPMSSALQADPMRVERDRPAAKVMRWCGLAVSSLVAISMAAWLCSTPLTAIFFNMVSPISLVGNILVVPMAFVVVLTGCLSVIGGVFSSLLAEVFNHANRVFISILLTGVEWCVSVPGGHRFVVSPPWPLAVCWYAVIPMVALARGARRVLAVLIALALLAGIIFWNALPRVRLDVVDVGDGMAVLLDGRGGNDVLIDAGSAYHSRRLLKHLKRRGVNRLRALVLTHADAGHVGGVVAVLDRIDVDEVWCTTYKGRSRVYKEALVEVERRGIPIRFLEEGERGLFADDVAWEVLHPPNGSDYRRADDASLVFRISRSRCSILIMGGAGAEVENLLLDARAAVAAPIVILGDRGGPGACSSAWLDEVRPQLAIISVGPANPKGLPDRDLLHRLEEHGVDVMRTDYEGTISISMPGRGGRHDQPAFTVKTEERF